MPPDAGAAQPLDLDRSRRGRRWPPRGAGGAMLQRRHMRRIESDPESDALRRSRRAAGRSGVRSADGTMLHAEVFGPDDGTTVVLAHGWTETLDYWTYVIRDLTGQGIPRRRLRPARARRQRSRGRRRLRDRALRRGPRGGAATAASPTAAAPSSPATRSARCRSPHGPSITTSRSGVFARRDDQHRRRRPDRRALLFPLPAFAQAVNKAIAVRGFLGARAPLPRISTPASHAAIRYIAFGPEATPGADRLLRADAGRHARPTRAPASGSRCPRWSCTTRSSA